MTGRTMNFSVQNANKVINLPSITRFVLLITIAPQETVSLVLIIHANSAGLVIALPLWILSVLKSNAMWTNAFTVILTGHASDANQLTRCQTTLVHKQTVLCQTAFLVSQILFIAIPANKDFPTTFGPNNVNNLQNRHWNGVILMKIMEIIQNA